MQDNEIKVGQRVTTTFGEGKWLEGTIKFVGARVHVAWDGHDPLSPHSDYDHYTVRDRFELLHEPLEEGGDG